MAFYSILLTLLFSLSAIAESPSERAVMNLTWQTYTNCSVYAAVDKSDENIVNISIEENNLKLQYKMNIEKLSFPDNSMGYFEAHDGGSLEFESNKNAVLGFTLKVPQGSDLLKVSCKTYCHGNRCN